MGVGEVVSRARRSTSISASEPMVMRSASARPGWWRRSRTTTPAAVGGSNDKLAYTGADVLPWAAAGTVLVLGGAAMVIAGRRKPGRSH